MTDQQYPRSTDDEADPEVLAAVQRALADLTFLRPDEGAPDASPAPEPMPDWAWARISSALSTEAAHAEPSARHPRSRLVRWGGGLVAASVAVLAVGLGVQVFSAGGASDSAVVAGGGPAPSPLSSAQAFAEAAPADAAAEADATVALSEEATGLRQRQFSFAGIPPILKVLGSTTDYTPATMQDQVTSALAAEGMVPMKEMPSPSATVDVPADVPAEGFLATPESVRDCITKLTNNQASTALLIDQSRYQGEAASIVVAPDYDVPAAQAPDLSMIEVWVVDPECDVTWRMRFRLGR